MPDFTPKISNNSKHDSSVARWNDLLVARSATTLLARREIGILAPMDDKLELIRQKIEDAKRFHERWLEWYAYVYLPAMEKEPREWPPIEKPSTISPQNS